MNSNKTALMEGLAARSYSIVTEFIIDDMGVKEYADLLKEKYDPVVMMILPATLKHISETNTFIRASIPTLMEMIQTGVEHLAVKHGYDPEELANVMTAEDDAASSLAKMKAVVEVAFQHDAEKVGFVMALFNAMSFLLVFGDVDNVQTTH